MKQEDLDQCVLPLRRTGRIVELLARVSVGQILLFGLMAYMLPVFFISAIEFWCSSSHCAWIKTSTEGVYEFWKLVYFNFVTILTIGYGDYTPHGSGACFLSVVEALMGTGIMTITLSALVAKFLSPPKDAIVFSRYAYYCTEPQEFLVIFLNTTNNRIVNPEISNYFKLAGDWRIRPAWRSPLITRAVQTFHTEPCPEKVIVANLDIYDPENRRDAFRFGISGQIGNGSFSAAIEYGSSDIIVIPNRDELTAYKGFWFPNLVDPEFQKMFHYRPKNAPTLVEYVRTNRNLRNTQLES